PLGIRAHFPLWGRETGGLAREMLAAGIDARIVTLDPRHLPAALCGARFDAAFLDGLPATVDPCGERGEFHTVVADGPGFARPLNLTPGKTVERGGFVYTDFRLGPRFWPGAPARPERRPTGRREGPRRPARSSRA